jgi:hypothetical protein
MSNRDKACYRQAGLYQPKLIANSACRFGVPTPNCSATYRMAFADRVPYTSRVTATWAIGQDAPLIGKSVTRGDFSAVLAHYCSIAFQPVGVEGGAASSNVRGPYVAKRFQSTQNQHIGTGLAEATRFIPDDLVPPHPANHELQTLIFEGMPRSSASTIASSHAVQTTCKNVLRHLFDF